MDIASKTRTAFRLAAMAVLLTALGHASFGIPGHPAVHGRLSELALLLCLPFLPRWHHALLLSACSALALPPGAPALPEAASHMLAFPLLWSAFGRWGLLRETPRFAAAWFGMVGAYYFLALIPVRHLALLAQGTRPASGVWAAIVADARSSLCECLTTSVLAILYFLLIRALRIRTSAQSDLEERNAELSRHKQILEAQYDSTHEGILLISPEGRMVSWNRRFVEIWQVPQDILASGSERLAFQYAKGLLEDPGELEGMTALLRDDPTAAHEDILHLKGGRTLVRFTTPIRYGGNPLAERMWFFRDITELEKAQAEREDLQARLFQGRKMEAIGQLAGGVAHDFNNSLGVILGAAELAGMARSPEDVQGYLKMVETAARRSSSLTRKLLSFSRQGMRSMELIDAGAVVRDTVSLLESSIDKRIAIGLESTASRNLLRGDKGLLQNALMNLGINASHAMPEGGTLTFALRNVELAPEYCEASPFELRPGPYLEISVQDTGCGIPQENLPRIFEPFFTTKEEGKGTGLGLASVYGTVQDHGGALSVYSESGTGTVFRLSLPLPAETTGQDESLISCVGEIPAGTGTILLVDDEAMIRKTARTMLEGIGYAVLDAADGRQALELLREQGTSIDLVLLDMIMPKQNGRETFEAMRSLFPSLPVVVCSGFSKPGDLDSLRAMDMSGFLPKPYGRAELAQAVASALTTARRTPTA